ncbi:MAG: amino acid adenylation domain-containing protein [Iphinoe sp. HA4291-MV1]|nr:amino acid adenylation domain-containing protein [Iphinoe sp. HA4291-MV1]
MTTQAVLKNMHTDDKSNSQQSKKERWNAFRDVLSSSRQGSPLQQISRESDIPLSFAQQRFWLINQLEPNSAYNEYVAFLRLEGSLNVVALEQSLNEIRRRHEVLRTTFAVVNGQPIQKISSYAPVALSVIDLRKFPHFQRDAIAQQQANEEAQQLFDLVQGSLLRVKLLRLKEEEYIFLVTIHHIIYDGWSHGVFIQELSELYKAFSNSKPSPLPELPIQYADFAQWHREWLQGKILQSQLDYWKQQLSGNLPVLHLPTDRLQPPIQSYRGACHSQVLPKELINALKFLSESEDVTLFMTLLAAFKTLLYRYTGQEDILVGSPIANRNRREISGLIGCFINTLVLRTDLSENPTFSELLGRVRSVALEAFTHQDLPFEKLVEELQPERNLSRSPLFQVMFVFQNAPTSSLELEGLTLSPLPVENKTAKFNLTLSLEQTTQGLMAVWEYNTDLFDASTIERMAGHFQILLESIVTRPQQHISELPLLTVAEQHQLLVEWNDTQVDYDLDQCIHELFEVQSKRTPDVVAVMFENQRLTYRELNERANKIAHYLRTLGVGPDVLVGICVERSLEMVVGLLGILKAGGAYVPLDANYPQERLSYMLWDAAVSVLLTQQHLLESLPLHQANVVCLDSDWEVISTQSQENPVSKVSANNLAYVIYTSGSTGKPKGIAMRHYSLVSLIVWQIENAIADSKAKTLQFAPVSFDVSFQEIFSTWCVGSTLVLISEEIRQDAYALLRLIVEEEIERLFLPVVALQQLAQVADSSLYHPTNLREIITAGEQLQITPSVVSFFNKLPACLLQNHYGPSETHVVTSFTLEGSAKDWQAIPPIGRPIANTQIYILDDNLQPVPIGVAGELYIGGAGVARGYLNRPDLTLLKFILDPFSPESQARLYKTGDLARYLPNGNIQFLGRRDRQVKIRGFRIEPGEIETVLSTHPQVQQAVVVIREDKPVNKSLVAYLVSDRESLSSSQLRDFLKQKLPEYMIPSAFVMLEAMPLTPSGKVDRKALPAPDRELSSEDNFVLPRTPTEEAIAHIFTSVLGLQQISIHDNFFEIGGHSLLATQVISRLRETFKVELPLRRLFELPTVAQLSQTISEFEQNKADIIVKSCEGIENLKFTITPTQRTSNQFPLSFSQERLWFLDRLEGLSNKYNIPIALQIQGNLNVAVLEQALATIIQRHEILRTRFTITNGTLVQVIDSNSNLTLPVVDLQEFPQDQRSHQVQQKVKEELETPFDLSKSHSLRVTLLQVENKAFVLLVSMHHIVSDGWSIGIFIQELFTLYQAFLSKNPSPFPNLPIQYADFAVWQRQWWRGERLETQLNYWKQQLSNALPILELPSDRPRQTIQTFRGKSLSFTLNTELNKQLQTLSKNTGTTLFMTLLAAFATLLYRYSGQEDISIGSPIANRNRSEIETLIGSFVNTLVLRIRIQDNPSFNELLTQVRQVALEAYEHQDAPFEKVVEGLQPERSLSQNPLFQVMFVLQNTPLCQVEVPGLSLTPLALEAVTTNFDLTLSMTETKEGLTGVWEYSSDLFDEATIARMAENFQVLLEAIVTNSAQPIGQLLLLTDSQRHQLLQEWNNTVTEYATDKTIAILFEEQVQKTPHAVAVEFEEEQLTYQQLNAKANQLAHYLQKIGVGAEVLVGICVERSIEMVVGLLGILKAGGAYVPLDPAYPQERLAFMVSDSQMPVLLTQQQLLEGLPQHQARVICLDTDWEIISKNSKENPISSATSDDLAYVIYTSGSTGKPKGVQILHGALVNFLKSMECEPGLSKSDIFLAVTSISFDIAALELYSPLITGARLVLSSREVATDGRLLIKQLNTFDVTVMQATPATWRMLLAMGWQGSPQFKILCGGEALPRDLAEQLLKRGACLWNLYGPTETTIWSTACKVEASKLSKYLVPIGNPIANTQVYLLDSHLQPVPIGVPGEVYIGGEGLARGYLNRPELTSEKFITNPFDNSKSNRLYKTGDLACYLPDGNIEYLDRIDYEVKIRGFRIELGEIEAVLSQHPIVHQTVVIAREDLPGDKHLVAYLVSNQEEVPTISDLRRFLKQQLPEYMMPSAFVIVDALPLTPNGKVDRRALPAPDKSSFLDKSFVPPRTQSEKQLAQIWSEILNVQSVGIRDNFFELGGHSLMAVRLMVKIEQEFGKTLPIATLFQFPTIEDLANHLKTNKNTPSSSNLVPIQPKGDKTPLFCVHPVGGDVLCYADLAHHLGDTQPFWALRSQGIRGECEPLTRIEDMAATYIKALQTIQPQGPYQLAGWSMGGAIAFEMAVQLVASGQKVSLLALIDSYAPISQFKGSLEIDEATLLADWVKNLSGSNLAGSVSVEKLRLLKPHEQFNYVLEQAKRDGLLLKEMGQKQASSLFQTFKVNRLSLHSYIPQPYPGRITLFCASETPNEENQDPTHGWGELAMKGIDMHNIASNHFSIMRSQILSELIEAELTHIK